MRRETEKDLLLLFFLHKLTIVRRLDPDYYTGFFKKGAAEFTFAYAVDEGEDSLAASVYIICLYLISEGECIAITWHGMGLTPGEREIEEKKSINVKKTCVVFCWLTTLWPARYFVFVVFAFADTRHYFRVLHYSWIRIWMRRKASASSSS